MAAGAGAQRRWFGIAYATALLLEAAGALVLAGFAFLVLSEGPTPQYFSSWMQPTMFEHVVFMKNYPDFIAYVLPLLAIAGLSTSCARRRITRQAVNVLDAAVLVAQPFLLALGAIAVETAIDDARLHSDGPVTFLAWLPVVGTAFGIALVIGEWRRVRAVLSASRRSVACLITCCVAVLPCLALSASGVTFGTAAGYTTFSPVIDQSAPTGVATSFVKVRRVPTRSVALDSVSCAGGSCSVLGAQNYLASWGDDILYVKDHGRWVMRRLPQTLVSRRRADLHVAFFPDLFCSRRGNCLVVAGLASDHPYIDGTSDPTARTSDGGRSWQPEAPVTPPDSPLSLFLRDGSCDSAGDCLLDAAVGVYETTTFGSHWSALHVPVGYFAIGTWCTASAQCLALFDRPPTGGPDKQQRDAWLYRSSEHLRNWTRSRLRLHGTSVFMGGYVRRFACSSLTRCLVLGTSGITVIREAGGRWSTSTAPEPTALRGGSLLGCFGSVCYASSRSGSGLSEMWRSEDGGTTWTKTATPPKAAQSDLAIGRVLSFDCASPLNCLGVLGQLFGPSALVATHNGGRSWSIEHLPSPPASWLPAPVVAPPTGEGAPEIG